MCKCSVIIINGKNKIRQAIPRNINSDQIMNCTENIIY